MSFLAAPQFINASVQDQTSIVVFWSFVPGAAFYEVEVNGTIFNTGTDTTYIDTGFAPGETRIYRARALPDPAAPSQEPGPWSAPFSLVAPGEDPLPPVLALLPPANLTGDQLGLDRARFQWFAVDRATGYEVRVNGGDPVDVGVSTLRVITGLVNGETVALEVRAYNDEDDLIVSDWSGPVSVTIVGLGVPVIELAVGISQNVIEVIYSSVAAAESYDIRIDANVVITGNFGQIARVTGLQEATTYRVRVRARAGSAISDWSAPVEATTLRAVPIILRGVARRLSYFAGNRHLSARALNAEFNNIYALLAGGELELSQEIPAPPPPPPPPITDPGEPVPPPTTDPGDLPPPLPPPPPPADPDAPWVPASPVYPDTEVYTGNEAQATHTVPLPSGSAGDLLVVFLGARAPTDGSNTGQNNWATLPGWMSVFGTNNGLLQAVRSGVYTRISDGTETSLSVAHYDGFAGKLLAVAYRLPGVTAPASASAYLGQSLSGIAASPFVGAEISLASGAVQSRVWYNFVIIQRGAREFTQFPDTSVHDVRFATTSINDASNDLTIITALRPSTSPTFPERVFGVTGDGLSTTGNRIYQRSFEQ